MKIKTTNERKYESKIDDFAETVLKGRGYSILGYREYISKTEIDVTKDGISLIYICYHSQKNEDVIRYIDMLDRTFEMTREINSLKKELGRK